ncbi:MAG: hypothetical protein H6719_35940 [Sandaracinaceae bacterium]|nr:hypothetical protein [Sandaracinaceae bacterium]
MRRSWAQFAVIALALAGCSALINPDVTQLGDDPDAGPDVVLMDAGTPPPPGTDAGTPPPGTDAGPPPPGTDAGPPPPGTDAGPPGVDAGCTPSCAGGVLAGCDGDAVTCPLGCALDGSAQCAEMIPSNVDASLWRSDARDLVASASPGGAALFFDTTECMARMVDSMVVTQSDGTELCVLIVGDLTIQRNAGLVVRGSRPLVVMASGDITIEQNGVLDVGARTNVPGPGGAAAGTRGATDGGGAAGGEGGSHVGSFDDGGGGGGGFCGDGGHGGTGGGGSGGPGGGALSATEVGLLIPLRAGSGGGMGEGGMGDGDPVGNAGVGGAGGGAVQLSTRGTITIDGWILAGGGGGSGGRNDFGQWGAGGGGGSGGGVLVEAPTVSVGAMGGVVTTGGGGAGSASDSRDGFDGENGAMTLGPANGGFRGGNNYGADGGDSGGGDAPAGLDGGDNLRGGANGGGGGGGVGCVVYRTGDGVEPAGARARTSGSTDASFMHAPVLLR